jgi:hypothetical protein
MHNPSRSALSEDRPTKAVDGRARRLYFTPPPQPHEDQACRGPAGPNPISRARHYLPIEVVGGQVAAHSPLPSITVGKQLFLVVQQFLVGLGAKLEVRSLSRVRV